MKLKESDIREVEEKYNFSYPPSLREFYLTEDTDEIPRSYFHSSIPDKDVGVDLFLPIKNPPVNIPTISDCLKTDLDTDSEYSYPEYMIPFAMDAGGNSICINVQKGDVDYGKIYFFTFDTYPDCSFELIANSFEEFYSNLKEDI